MIDDRELVAAQTGRNVRALEYEAQGCLEDAIALYEQNVAEGFTADLPYGRLVAIYTKRGQPDEAVRVLERAVAVFEALPRRHPVRTPRLKVFRARLKEARKALAPPKPRRRGAASDDAL